MSSTTEQPTGNENKSTLAGKNMSPWTRSADFWYSDAQMVIRVDTVLYKIHIGILLQISEVMNAIFTIPDGKALDDPTREGTEQLPVLLSGITTEEFDDFLGGFVYPMQRSNISDENKERVFTNLLKLSDLYIIEAGKAHAKKNLDDIYLSPARRLELACRYGIDDWVEPAVKWILNHPFKDLTPDDLSRIGLQVFAILVKGKEHMDVEIKRTASIAPAMIEDPSWECQNHKSCAKVWKRSWRDHIGRRLLHPTFPIRPQEILWHVQKFESHSGLNPRVVEATAREILKTHNMLRP
ncbi:hypothetical protein B0H14DRAFT_3438659 [Mycena olivaceomarginata]|nr:hypothetical protein B0H14DRAFT_3438659 [Mycena olivaceomarginata]